MKDAPDAEFDWGDESSLHRLGRAALVALAFVAVAVVLAGISAGLAFLWGNIWLALFSLLLLAFAIEWFFKARRHT